MSASYAMLTQLIERTKAFAIAQGLIGACFDKSSNVVNPTLKRCLEERSVYVVVEGVKICSYMLLIPDGLSERSRTDISVPERVGTPCDSTHVPHPSRK